MMSMTQVDTSCLDNELEALSGELGRMRVETPAIFVKLRTRSPSELQALEAARDGVRAERRQVEEERRHHDR